MSYSFYLIFIICGFMSSACSEPVRQPPQDWAVLFSGVGSSSSPRAADLNGDDIKDIVVGAGKAEFQATDSAVLALDGRTGELLWAASARDQLFGSPLFLDVNRDQQVDVIIGGRSAELLALDGITGGVLWEYFPAGDSVDATQHQLYNFYNPQLIEDRDEDGVADLLVTNGGFVRARPDDSDRPAGKLMLISGRSGKVLAEALMPDGKETYMSCLTFRREGKTYVIYGSGGETVSGKLYLNALDDLQRGSLDAARVLAESDTKGFIAPPVRADITQDGVDDLIVNAVDGRTIAIDGLSYETLWEFTQPGTEAYCSLAVGQFDADGVPDLFTNYGIGVFPDLMRSVQVALSGRDGTPIYQDTLGSFHYGSPVAYDTDGDGRDEVFYHTNEYIPGVVKNVLKVFDFARDTVRDLTFSANGANLGSTPLLSDLDGDGYLDIVLAHENNPIDLFSLEAKAGLYVKVLRTEIKLTQPIRWGSYMGSHYDGIYRMNEPPI